ncbi:hypothetical protein AB4274_19175 [Vibrio sp. 10N.261.55.A10]|uniref:hypothetical protein n=1 Tax=Vibrio sp. 10N.261.55.A10 TaxID=3229687 RepID=UPI003550F034
MVQSHYPCMSLFMVGTLNMAQVLIPTLTVIPSWLKDTIRYTGGVGAGKANLDIFKEFSIGASYNKTIQFGTKTSVVAALQQLQFRVANTPLMLGVKQIIGQSSVTSGLGVVAEYDNAIDNRWTVSAFYGLGKATVEGSLSDDESVDAYGAGFRYQIACRYGLHMGVDLAFSDVDSAFYITVGSGF